MLIFKGKSEKVVSCNKLRYTVTTTFQSLNENFLSKIIVLK